MLTLSLIKFWLTYTNVSPPALFYEFLNFQNIYIQDFNMKLSRNSIHYDLLSCVDFLRFNKLWHLKHIYVKMNLKMLDEMVENCSYRR